MTVRRASAYTIAPMIARACPCVTIEFFQVSRDAKSKLGIVGVVARLDIVDSGEEAATCPLGPRNEILNRICQTSPLKVLRGSCKFSRPSQSIGNCTTHQSTGEVCVE